MTMDLKQLFEVVGERISLDEALDFSDRTLFGTQPFVTPVQVTGEIANQAGVVVLSMQLSYTMHLTCDRCLDEFERAFSCSWEHLLVAEPLTDDSDTENIEVPGRSAQLGRTGMGGYSSQSTIEAAVSRRL